MEFLWRHGAFILFVSFYFGFGVSMLSGFHKNWGGDFALYIA